MGGRGVFSPAARQRIRQTETRVNKGIKSYKKQIAAHENYIRNPKQKYGDQWDKLPSGQKRDIIKHWEHEVKTFKGNIDKLKKKLQGVIDENKNK